MFLSGFSNSRTLQEQAPCAYICVSLQQLSTAKPSCQLTVVITVAMSTGSDRGPAFSGTLNLQPKVRSRKEGEKYAGDGVKRERIQVLRKMKKKKEDNSPHLILLALLEQQMTAIALQPSSFCQLNFKSA